MKLKHKRTENNIDNLLNNLEYGEIGILKDKGWLAFKDSNDEPYVCKLDRTFSAFTATKEGSETYEIQLNGRTETTTCYNDIWYYFTTDEIRSTKNMFRSSSVASVDLSRFRTDYVTNMNRMFVGCSKLTSLDVSSFDTSKVTDMSYMFGYCSGLTSLDLSSFDTSKVTMMSGMFCACPKLTSLDISKFDTSKVTMMSGMFLLCSKLNYITLGPNFFKTTQQIPFNEASKLGFNEDSTDNGWLEHLATVAPEITDGQSREIALKTDLKNSSWAAPHLATLQSKGYTVS